MNLKFCDYDYKYIIINYNINLSNMCGMRTCRNQKYIKRQRLTINKKIMEKELLNIKIQTVPNGYAFTVGSEKYMYFTLEELAEGFLYHVCLGELGATSNEDIKTFLDAAVAYRADDGQITKKMTKLANENERLQSICENQKKTIASLRNLLKKEKEELTKKSPKGKTVLDEDENDDDEDNE